MPKLDFNQELDSVKGEGAEEIFKNTLVQLLKQSSTAQSITEAEALRDIRGEIARSEGPIEINESDLNLIEENVNRALQQNGENQGIQIPNKFIDQISDFLSEGREQIEEQRQELEE